MSEKRLLIGDVLRVDGYGLIVVFSDGTSATYTVEELARLRPVRGRAVDAEDPPKP